MRTFLRLLLILLLLLGNSHLHADPPITLQIRGHAGMAPHTFLATVVVERHDQNRVLCLRWGLVEEQGYNSSCTTLEGAQEPRMRQFRRTLEEPGIWDVMAEVSRSDGSRHRAVQQITVMGGM